MTTPEVLELRRWSAEDLMEYFVDVYLDKPSYFRWIATDHRYRALVCPVEDWRPDDVSTGQWLMVVKKMREPLPDGSDGFNFNLNWQAHKGITMVIAQFHKISPFLHGQGADDDPMIALLRAARTAWETKP